MVGGSERNREEPLDHRVHLLGHLELVEIPGTNGDPDLQVRLDLEQPERVGIRPEPGPVRIVPASDGAATLVGDGA